jgi:hypothetical protein
LATILPEDQEQKFDRRSLAGVQFGSRTITSVFTASLLGSSIQQPWDLSWLPAQYSIVSVSIL